MVLATVVNLSVGHRDFGISPGEGEVSMTLRACIDEAKRCDDTVNFGKVCGAIDALTGEQQVMAKRTHHIEHLGISCRPGDTLGNILYARVWGGAVG